ncbi:MAG: LLM class flavin-dependent oxidoreductase [Rhodospirillales bacterium]
MTDLPLRFGVFYAPFHALDEGPTQLFQRDLELMTLFDRLGFDEAWIGEHHSGGFETIGAPEVFIAAAAERTRRIRLGTGVKSLPYHNPFILADTMVQLDHMTMGRTMFGVGPGALPSDAMQMGIDPRETRRRMDEALAIIMRLLAGERVTAETDWFRLQDAKLQFDCFTRPRMEMAVTTIRSPSGAEAAGRHGIGLLSLGGTSDEALAAYAKNWTVCEETARAHGQTVDRRGFRIAIQMHLAETREQAKADVRYGLDAYARYTQDVLPFGPIPPGVTDVYEFVVENKRGIIGTPEDAIAHIEHAQAGAGGFGVVLLMAHDWADPAATAKSYELFARRVIPHFHRQLDARRASYAFAKQHHQRFLDAAKDGLDAAQRRYDARKKS